MIGKDPGSASTLFSSQPIKYFIFIRGYIFQRTRASVQSGLSNYTGLSIFDIPRDNILNVLR